MSTLREMIEGEMWLTAHCQGYQPICTHYATLKLELLVQRLGWDFDIISSRQAFRRRLICSICGARFPALIAVPHPPIPEAVAQLGRSGAMMSVEESTKRALALEQAYREHNAAQPEPFEWQGKNKGKGRKFGRR